MGWVLAFLWLASELKTEVARRRFGETLRKLAS